MPLSPYKTPKKAFYYSNELFFLSGSREDFFEMTPLHFCDYLNFEEDLALLT
jgi:hypothetical protein